MRKVKYLTESKRYRYFLNFKTSLLFFVLKIAGATTEEQSYPKIPKLVIINFFTSLPKPLIDYFELTFDKP